MSKERGCTGERKASIYFVGKEGKQYRQRAKKLTQKTTVEIRRLLKNAKLDFDEVENRALNNYLSKILHSCPFTEDVCTTNQCVECSVFKKVINK